MHRRGRVLQRSCWMSRMVTSVLAILAFCCVVDTFGRSVPLASPSSVAVVALRDDISLNCDISSVFDSIVWYKVSSDLLSRLPADGTECGQTLPSGDGSGSGRDVFLLGTPAPTNDNMINITGDIVGNGSVYNLSPVQFGDEGYYVCVVQTGGEQACFSNNVTVTVAPIGSVVISPENHVFEQGRNATLNCNNEGGPNNIIIWEVEGDRLPFTNSHQISVFVNVSSGGNYTCIVSNAAGVESYSTMFYVYPLIVGNPDPLITVTNGTNTSLSCDAESFPEPVYEWIHPNGLTVRDEVIQTNRRNVLGFNPALFGDEGVYVCRVFIIVDGIVYDVNSTATVLTISPEGTAMATPDTLDGFPGDNATFNCSSLGGPGNSFTWMKQNDRQVVGSEPQLTITDLDAFDGGQYQCIVENGAGNDSTDVTLYIGPAFMENPLAQRPTLSEAFFLSCIATGFPAPDSITWFHNGTLVDSSFSGVNITTHFVNVYTTRSTLMISSAQPEHSGDYYCVADSPRQVYSNITSGTASIAVLNTPERPRNVRAVQIQSRYLVLTWVEPHDNNAPILGYFVLYNQPVFAGGEVVMLNVFVTMVNVTELYPGVTYNFTVIAFNEVGNSSSSAVIPSRTPEEIPSSFPQNVNVSVNSSTVILVTWEEVPALDRNGIITIYEVLYDPLETFDGELTPQIVNTTDLFAYLTGLQQNIDYFISVRAYTSIGPGPYSEETSAMTPEDNPDSPPMNVTAQVLSHNSIVVTWSEVPPIDQNGEIVGYDLIYAPLEAFDGAIRQTLVNVPASSTGLTLSGLEEYVGYNISVRASTQIGPGPFSVPLTAVTEEAAPTSAPSNVRVEAVSSVELYVTWDEVPPVDQNGIIIAYEVFSVPETTFDDSLMPDAINTTNMSLSLVDLHPHVNYTISVRAYTSVGHGPSEIIVQITPEDSPASPPRNITTIVLSPTSILITWEEIPVFDQNGIIIAYEVLYEPLDTFGGEITAEAVNTTNVLIFLSALQEFVYYNISVRAYTIAGPGPYSDIITDMTPQDVPSSSPENIKTEVLSSSVISVTWDEVLPINQNGIITEYEVLYKPLETFGGCLSPLTMNTTDLIVDLIDLMPFVSYNISVRAYTSVGAGPYSEPITNRTLEEAPNIAPTIDMVTVVNSTAINITWEEIPPMNRNGIITTYEVLFEPSETFDGQLSSWQMNTSDLYILLRDLEEFVGYNISVRAYTSTGPGPYSDELFAMTMEDSPASPPDNVETVITSATSILVRWNDVPPIDQNGIITDYEVRYIPHETFGGVISMQIVNTSDMFYLLDNLEEYVNYTVSVRAYTSVGPGPYSDPITDQTLQDVPASPPGNVSTEVQSSTSIMVTWEDIPFIDQNGVIVTYEVLYEPLETFNGNVTKQTVNTTNRFVSLMDLEEFSNYSISVRGYTVVGPGNYSVPVLVMTLEDVPGIAPINVRAQVLFSTSINVSWEEIPLIRRNGIIILYEVLYEPQETFGGAIGPETVNTTNLFYVLVGLQEYVDYAIFVRAYTRVGFGPYSQRVTNQTFQDTPASPPDNVTAEVLTSTSIMVSWGKVPAIDRNGIIITYELLLEPLETFGGFIVDEQYNATNLSLVITDLQEFVNYSISVRAYTIVGPGNYSGAVIRMTLEDVPAIAPLNVISEVTSPTSISMVWEEIPPIDRNGIITMYEILYVPFVTFGGEISANTVNTTDLSYLLENLQEYVSYNVSVRAYTRIGSGPYSVPIDNQTMEAAPASPPINIVASSPSSTTINVRWEEVPSIDQNGIIITYEVCYQPLETFNGTIMKETANSSELFRELTGLEGFVAYNISVRAYTSQGPGPFSDDITQITQEDVPAVPPPNVTSEVLSSTMINVTWKEIPPIDRNGNITNYTVLYVLFHDDLTAESVNTTDLFLTIFELDKFALYNISVRAYTSVGPGPFSVPITNQTDEDVPGAVGLPPEVRDEVTATSAVVRWSPPENPNGVITSYKVNYVVVSSDPGATQSDRRKRQSDVMMECIIGGDIDRNVTVGNVTMTTLTGLTPYTVYSFQVVASTRIGEGPEFSPPQNFSTEQDVSTPPQDLVAMYVSMENASSTALLLMWTPPLCDYGDRTGYTITHTPIQLPSYGQREEGQESSMFTSPYNLTEPPAATTFVLSSLTPNTNYSITICATTIVGCSNSTDAVGLTNEDAPQNPILLNISSSELSSDKENNNHNVDVEFTWSRPSQRNGSYYFELEYSAVQNFDGGRSISTGPITGEQLMMQLMTGLPYATYEVSIFAYNIKRGRTYRGPLTTRNHLSIPIAPTPVNNLFAAAANSSTIFVNWSLPSFPNGPISFYNVYFRELEGHIPQDESITDEGFHTVKIAESITATNLTALKPYTNYTIHVRAIIDAENVETIAEDLIGAANTEIITRTHGNVPNNLILLGQPPSGPTSTTIPIEIPDTGQIDTGYIIAVEIVVVRNPIDEDPRNYMDLKPYMEGAMVYITAAWNEQQVQSNMVPHEFTIGDGSTAGGYINVPLQSNTRYGYFIRYVIENDADAADPHEHYSVFATAKTDLPFSVPGLVIGLLIIVTVIIAAVIIAIVIFRKRKTKGLFTVVNRDGYMGARDSIPHDSKKEKFSPVIPNPLAIEHNGTHEPISVEEFADHVRLLHANDDYLFTEEYTSVEPSHSPRTEATRRPENISKNRYANITAYDHSRVKLLENPGVPGSDYINANFLDGYDRDKAFIATQGPVPGSVEDFWRMIWEQGTATIIMLTNLEEKGRIKCYKYWPDEKTQRHEKIRIMHQETLQLAEYTVRTFSLQQENSKEERIVRQFHFTAWPDHGVPEYPSPLLGFVRKVMNSNPQNAGPMVVHCSAGVGRTGTFITLHCQLQKIRAEGALDIFGFVRGMRRNRCFMVQTESQYVFIHDALLEAIDCGVTEVPARKLREEYRKLGIVDVQRGQTGLEIEFTKLQSSIRVNPMKTYCSLPSNKPKNRYTDMEMLPYDKTRVKLRPSPGVSGSDYINASHIDGYHKQKAFIATQAPLPDTTEDFWRMVWEQNCATIVMLTKEKEGGRVKCHKYWPDSGAKTFSHLQVILHAVNEYPDYILREFKIIDTRDDSSIPVKQFQYTGWPEEGVPDVGSGLIDVIGQVQKWQRSSGDRPIVVHCSGGCGRTGTYIAISILLERLKTEGVVDVFQTARTLRLQRPSMIQSIGQYEFCYKTVLEFLVSFDTYANFK